ncbi:MAG: CoB--CoM heterodisulfide reductase iron-sulfur subunit A family protein [Candidatus Thorarchaeota archaeon]|nr:MAG: CoB--CoM heterodisulfide reductase iron-sulfur subunit A family protein [Candidatus Thorarchaeota archaeon]
MTEAEAGATEGAEVPRIGVFICHCGHNIAGTVDVEAVAKMGESLPYVEYSTHFMFMCADSGQQLIKEKIAEHNLNRVVVASCSPRMHEPTFRKVVEEANLNRYLFEQVNLREHVSWCHMREPVAATEKAADLVRMAVARAALLESLPIKTVEVEPVALVVGGGVTGLRASLDVADRGFNVVLVEKDGSLGGHVAKLASVYPTAEKGTTLTEGLIKRVEKHPQIKVFTNSKVTDLDGYIGNFDIKTETNGKEESHRVGTIIIATGIEPFKPVGYYAYGEHPDILTLAEVEEMRLKGEVLRPSNSKPPKTLAYIGCVASREAGLKGHEHCSRVCCTAVAKSAGEMKDTTDEVVILYEDLRTYGRGHEAIHREARHKHVIYSKFPPEKKPEVEVADGKIKLHWHDVFSGDNLVFEPDMLVLASGMVPPEGIDEVAKTFSLTRSPDGFFNPEHVKLAPLTTHTAGIMIAGGAQAAKSAAEAITDASGAAAKAVGLMARGEVEIESTISNVIEELCSSCHTCITACPYGAISMDESKDPPVAFVTEAKCHGCGTCAAACPSSAIVMLHSTDDQIMAMVEAYLTTYGESEGGAA